MEAEDETPEGTEEPKEAAPRKTVFYKGADPYGMPNLSELKETGRGIKKDIVGFIGEEAIEIFSQPARATAHNVLTRVRDGIRAFLAPDVSAPPCEATTKKGKVCGRSPCPYPSHIEDGE